MSRADEKRLAELGYKQELSREWSGFTNFAISFTIISVLAGCFTAFAFAWSNGGPIAISLGWPILSFLIIMVAFSMSELTSAFPTAGGPYWWANDLGGPGWSWMTGWFNIAGLIGIVASVGYGAAIFLGVTLSLYEVDIFGLNFADTEHVLRETWILFALILIGYTIVNILPDRFIQLMNNISVGWHLLGTAIVIGLLVFIPDNHQDLSFVFNERINNNGAFGGSTTALGFWVLVLPVGFLLTMYTETGYDASAHTAEETRGAAVAAAQGVWRSVFYSSIIGWILLLTFLFAVPDPAVVTDAAGFVGAIFIEALDSWAAKLIFIIATVGQLFCGAAGLTSASRTWYAFSRDRAIPGWTIFRRVNSQKVPFNSVIAVSVVSAIIAIPALFGENNIPFAFYALTGICAIGLYVAYVLPDLSEVAGRRRLPGRPLEPGLEVQAGQRDRDLLRDPGRVLAEPAVHAGGAAVERRFRHQPGQLQPAGDPDPPDLRGLVPDLGQELLQGSGFDPGGGRDHRGLGRDGPRILRGPRTNSIRSLLAARGGSGGQRKEFPNGRRRI